jgi:hypothetical protein
MTAHLNRGWRSRWSVDLQKGEARHGPTGLVVRFVRRDDGWDGQSPNVDEVFAALKSTTPEKHLASTLARLMRQAGDIFSEKNHER